MKKWKQYLKESKKRILNEFNRKDEQSVMDDGEHFSVAFEIEMETEGKDDDDDHYEFDTEEFDDARREAAIEHINFGDSESYFSDEITESALDNFSDIDSPADGEEMLEWYTDNTTGFSSNDFEWVKVAIALQSDPGVEKILDEAFKKAISDPM